MESNSNPTFTVMSAFICLMCLKDKTSSYCLSTYETVKVEADETLSVLYYTVDLNCFEKTRSTCAVTLSVQQVSLTRQHPSKSLVRSRRASSAVDNNDSPSAEVQNIKVFQINRSKPRCCDCLVIGCCITQDSVARRQCRTPARRLGKDE